MVVVKVATKPSLSRVGRWNMRAHGIMLAAQPKGEDDANPMLKAAVLAAILATAPAAATIYWRHPAAVPGLGGVREELQRLVNADGRRRVNHLCAVVQDVHEPPSPSSEGNSQQLIVHWRERAVIYSYRPADDGRIGPANHDESADIDLRTDVVATESEIAGSTTRVTRAFVNTLIARCQANGMPYVLLIRAPAVGQSTPLPH
jgi:hypothetical protein